MVSCAVFIFHLTTVVVVVYFSWGSGTDAWGADKDDVSCTCIWYCVKLSSKNLNLFLSSLIKQVHVCHLERYSSCLLIKGARSQYFNLLFNSVYIFKYEFQTSIWHYPALCHWSHIEEQWFLYSYIKITLKFILKEVGRIFFKFTLSQSILMFPSLAHSCPCLL